MEFDFNTPITKSITLNALYDEVSFDPTVTSFENIKKAMQTGNPSAWYPVGTLVNDKYQSFELPWRLVHYGTAKNLNGEEISGAYFMATKTIANTTNNITYVSSAIYTTLNDAPILSNGCYYHLPASVKAVATKILLPSYDSPGQTNYTPARIWIPSVWQVSGQPPVAGLEETWDYFWKGTNEVLTNNVNTTRSLQTVSNQNCNWWLRTWGMSTQNYYVATTGNIGVGAYSQQYYIAPAFFIAAYGE